MRRMQVLAAAAVACAVCAPTLAQAQRAPAAAGAQPTPIRVGQTVSGTLGATDPRLKERGRFRVYRFTATRGQRLIATMRSGDFDAYLTVARTISGITDEIASDDDRGGGVKNTDARARFTVPEDGTYLIVAQALDSTGVGGYTLALETAPATTTAAPREIRVGQVLSGRLDETDAILEDDETFYDSYVISGAAGQRLQIEMKSDSFDTYLNFGKMEGGEFSSIKTDDDGAGQGTNSRLTVTLPAAGEYVIRANEVGAKTGPYTIQVLERPAAVTVARPRPIEPNTEVRAELSDDDAQGSDDGYYDYYTYQGRAGERVVITMASDRFDTYLTIGTLNGTTFTELESNDDGPDGTNSRLEYTLPSAGTFVIRAKALSGEATGPYTIKVESSGGGTPRS